MKLFCIFFLAAQACLASDFYTGQAARLVIGQTTFTESDEGATNLLLGAAGGVAWANNILFVVDSNRFSADPVNNRVLLFPTNILPSLTQALTLPTTQPAIGVYCLVCDNTTATAILGQPDANNNAVNVTQSGMRTPTAAASDGVHFAVADSDNNRVLIWNSIPVQGPLGYPMYNQPADVVVGQPNFTSDAPASPPTAKSMRGPSGVWFQNGKMFVADTQNNRVLIWNSIPTANGAPADVVLGQPDFVTAVDDNSPALCNSNGVDVNNNPTYPALCGKTLSFPRFVLSDGTRMFIADGGNDRVLVFEKIPTNNFTPPDVILGEPDEFTDNPGNGADQFQTPSSLAWDGTNLYVADVFNRRVVVYTPADIGLPESGVRNAASLEVFALGTVTLTGTITEKDTVTVTIALDDANGNTLNTVDYTYTVAKTDTLADVVNGLVALIDKAPGDPNATARPDIAADGSLYDIVLTAKIGGNPGTFVQTTTTTSTNATEVATANQTALSLNLQDASQLAPGSLLTIFGTNLSYSSDTAPLIQGNYLPTTLANTQVYIDGIPSPLLSVTPTQISAQMPFEVGNRTNVSVYVRTLRADSSVQVSTPLAVPIVIANPGIFAQSGPDPRVGLVYHAFSSATGAISVDGTVNAGDVGTITFTDEDGATTQTYTYTVQGSDTLNTVQQAFVNLINADPNAPVTATASNVFTRILLVAKDPTANADSVTYAVNVTTGTDLILTALTSQLCCINTADAPVTSDNPAVPGEIVYIYSTGLGPSASESVDTGFVITPNNLNDPPITPVDSILAGGSTGNIIFTNYVPGLVGVYQVVFQLSSGLTSDPLTQLTIAQQDFVSNVVTFPVVAPPAT